MLNHVWLFATPWIVAHQPPLSLEFSRQEYLDGYPLPFPGDLPDPGIQPVCLTLQADSLPSEPPGKPQHLPESPQKVTLNYFFHEIKCCIRPNHWPSAHNYAVIAGGERWIISFQLVKSQVAPTQWSGSIFGQSIFSLSLSLQMLKGWKRAEDYWRWRTAQKTKSTSVSPFY